MSEKLHHLEIGKLSTLDTTVKKEALHSLESGKVVYLPHYFFQLQQDEQEILTPSSLSPKSKNISFDYLRNSLGGFSPQNSEQLNHKLHIFMQRFSLFARELIDTLFPQYQEALKWGRTSYRPAEIAGRTSSKRKDDTRLHVDAFPATPVYGLRILRVFCNINPNGAPRVWHLGEAFEHVLEKFCPRIPAFRPFKAKLLHLCKATKTLRSPYDHYMLHLHDQMKLDDQYQTSVHKSRFDFPSHSTWVVFTDHVSHAALSGQFLLEQTFYLPVEAMFNPALSPLKQWEQKKI